jgi:hypothetical protein
LTTAFYDHQTGSQYTVTFYNRSMRLAAPLSALSRLIPDLEKTGSDAVAADGAKASAGRLGFE